MSEIDPFAIRQGDRLALSRALTDVENDQAESKSIQTALFPYTGHAHLVGITGAPGTGKSTLVNQLVKSIRRGDQDQKPPKVAIIGVDPTSPFTGGALLGDRIRMRDLAGDTGVFIRSMASRGALGGLAHKTAAFTTILDGAGFDLIIIETVGAGQAEVDIARLAHTVVVVEAPGLGDDIQAIKAGILEIADILVVNKADRPGARNTAMALQTMLEMANNGPSRMPLAGKKMRSTIPSSAPVADIDQSKWHPPVELVVAIDGKGIDALLKGIRDHRDYLHRSGFWQVKENNRLREDLEALVRDKLLRQWWNDLDQDQFNTVLEDVINRKVSPIEAVDTLL